MVQGCLVIMLAGKDTFVLLRRHDFACRNPREKSKARYSESGKAQ
jgi:hypothetical protein